MMTVDVQNFSTHLAAVYSNLAKPILDVALYNYQLSQNVGAEGLILLTIFVQASAACCAYIMLHSEQFQPLTSRTVRILTPPFGKYTAQEAALSGDFRQVHSRLSEYAEEIAFFEGETTERLLAERSYFEVVKHVNRVLWIRVWHGILEEGIIK
jgi:ATP-binding cassette subfamily D (ALD) long-chain fatty acid import protein